MRKTGASPPRPREAMRLWTCGSGAQGRGWMETAPDVPALARQVAHAPPCCNEEDTFT